MAKVGNLLEEHTNYIGALYFILSRLQMKEFERSDDPLGAAAATARHIREALMIPGVGGDTMSPIVIEFFDQIVGDIRLKMGRGRG